MRMAHGAALPYPWNCASGCVALSSETPFWVHCAALHHGIFLQSRKLALGRLLWAALHGTMQCNYMPQVHREWRKCAEQCVVEWRLALHCAIPHETFWRHPWKTVSRRRNVPFCKSPLTFNSLPPLDMIPVKIGAQRTQMSFHLAQARVAASSRLCGGGVAHTVSGDPSELGEASAEHEEDRVE
jgi:hypothetical protein